MAAVFARVEALVTCLSLLLVASLKVPCFAPSRAGGAPLRALTGPRAASAAFLNSNLAVCNSSGRGIITPSRSSGDAGRPQKRKPSPGGEGRDPWMPFTRSAGGVLSSATVNWRPPHLKHCIGKQSCAGGPTAYNFRQPLNHDTTPEASPQEGLAGPSQGFGGAFFHQTQSPLRPFMEGARSPQMRSPSRPPGFAGSLRGSHESFTPPPRSQSGRSVAKTTATGDTAPPRRGAARASIEQPAILAASKPASLLVGGRAPLPWGRHSSPSSGRGGRTFLGLPADTGASGLRVGQHVRAACIRVWPRYALLRLLPPSAHGVAPEREIQGLTGFLHASGLRRDGMPLHPNELDKVNLTEILRVGAAFLVELIGPPSAANSQRWQLALHPPFAEGLPCLSMSSSPTPLPSGGAVQGRVDKNTQEGASPEVVGSCASSDEEWSQDDRIILLEGEERPLQRPVKGPSAGRRRRAALGGGQEDLQKKRVEGLCEGGRRGRTIWGGRRSGRERDDDQSAENFFLMAENPEDGFLLEAEEELLSAPAEGLVAEPLPRSPQSPTPVETPAADAAPETNPNSTAPRATAAKKRGKSAPPGPAKKSPSCPVRLEPRAAVVAVLGHVDHGKTTLLNALRRLTPTSPFPPCSPPSRSVQREAEHQEAGGITQRIGFFEVQLSGRLAASSPSVTFLDTPGHAAFSDMRLRAAKAADLVVLVVAANEGVQEETRRCLQACQELKLPLVVVLSKTDLVGTAQRNASKEPLTGAAFLAGPEGGKILGALAAEGLLTEPLGGSVQVAAVNAKGFLHAQRKGKPLEGIPGEDPFGMQHLLECIALQAEVLGLHAVVDGPGKGVVLETHCSAARGGSASLLLKEGTVKVGDWVVAGPSISRVRRLRFGGCAKGKGLVASSSCAAKPRAADVLEVFGFPAERLPALGEEALVVRSEEEAKKLQASPLLMTRRGETSAGSFKQEHVLRTPYVVDLKFAEAADSAMAAAAAERAHRQGTERLRRIPTKEEVLPVVIRAEAHGSAAAVAAALESLTAQRGSSGIWHLFHSDDASSERQQGFSKHLLQVRGNSSAGDAKDGGKEDGGDSRDYSDNSNRNHNSNSEEPALATRRVRVLRATAGECSSQDVHACTDEGKKGGLLIAFATKITRDAKRQAAEKHVELLQCDVIYDAIKAVEARLLSQSLFSFPLIRAVPGGTVGSPTTQATVKQLFNLSNGNVVAGCDVVSGKLQRGGVVRIVRAEGECIREATRVLSLRVGKEARDCVASPAQCGIICEGFKDWQVGDTILADEQPAQATSTS
ncbi:hypothetical protein Emag_001910 [Eimeria magna]